MSELSSYVLVQEWAVLLRLASVAGLERTRVWWMGWDCSEDTKVYNKDSPLNSSRLPSSSVRESFGIFGDNDKDFGLVTWILCSQTVGIWGSRCGGKLKLDPWI